MNTPATYSRLRAALATVVALIFVVACGSSGDSAGNVPPQTTSGANGTGGTTSTTGTIGLVFTDEPTDHYSAIKLDVVEAILIGGDDSQVVLFQGLEPIDLLDLTNFSEPIVFGEVEAGNYKKLRLLIENLELVPIDGGPSVFPRLPANGKIDLLHSGGFEVLPGRNLMVEIDMDANKSIHIVTAGNSGRVNFRPVVKVRVFDGGMDHKLARIEGSVDSIGTDGSFVLCDIDTPEQCMTVSTDGTTSVFDDEGRGTDFASLIVGDMVVVIGRYETDPDIVLNAIVLEIGGNAVQVKGNVVSEPADSEFLLLADDDSDLVIELQPGTKYFDETGEIILDAIAFGDDVEVEGVLPAKADPADPDLMRAALVFLESETLEQISGSIIEPLDPVARTFNLATDGGDRCVEAVEDAVIVLVSTTNSEAMTGTFADLVVDQVVDVFGTAPEGGGCFVAEEVIVDLDATP